MTSEVTKVGTSTTVLTGRDDAFAYDTMGNRSSTSGTSHNGNTANYTTNALNQYTQRTVPGIFDVAGAAGSGTTVTVNGSNTGVSRHGEYFFKGHALTNTANTVATTLTISDGSNSSNLYAFLALTAEPFIYDLDGNLTSDGRWDYTYDAENRLVSMQTHIALSPSLVANADAQRLEFKYDYLGRRVEKIVRVGYNGTSYTTVVSDEKFVYHGWNLMAKLNAQSSNALVASYYWGLDWSGTLQGAGGVGGLLLIQEAGNSYEPAYDGNGNLAGLIKASDGSVAAAYEYDAFGQTLRESGAYAASNPFRFSTKYTDIETGLVYYGLRYYSPTLGRFLNKDPIEERGGLNLYAFCGNNGVNGYDLLGMVVGTGGNRHNLLDGGGGIIFNVDSDQEERARITVSISGLDSMILSGGGQSGGTLYVFQNGDGTIDTSNTIYVLADSGAGGARTAAGANSGLGSFGGFNSLTDAQKIADAEHAFRGSGSDNTPTAGNPNAEPTAPENNAPNSPSVQSSTVTTGNAHGATFTQYLLNQGYGNETAAAVAAANFMRSAIGDGMKTWEYGAGIYRQIESTADGTHYETSYRVTPITPGFESASGRLHWYTLGDGVSQAMNPLFTSIIQGRTPGATMVAYIHNHPEGSNRFSTGDMDFALTLRINAYVLTSGSGLLTTPYRQIDWPPSADNLRGTPVSGVSSTPGNPRN